MYCRFQSCSAKLPDLLAVADLAAAVFFFFDSFAALACAAFLPAFIKTDMLN